MTNPSGIVIHQSISNRLENTFRNRTAYWPTGATPERLAVGMLFGGAVLIFAVVVAAGKIRTLVVGSAGLWAILLIQSILTAIGYWGFFHLQRQTSPTFLSQLGFVITPAGMLFGIVFYDESYGLAVWGGGGAAFNRGFACQYAQP